MAVLNTNTIYLTLDGYDLKARFKTVKISPKNNSQDTTAGSGVTHVQSAAGLDEYGWDMDFVWDTTYIANDLRKLKPGNQVTADFGPDSNTSGRPRMRQLIQIDECPFEVDVEKKTVVMSVKAHGAEAPEVNLFDGGKF